MWRRRWRRLTLAIVGKSLLGVDIESRAREIGEALTGVMQSYWLLNLPLSHLIERLPLPRFNGRRRARAALDEIIYAMIAERRTSGADRGDLLSMLMLTQEDADAGGMSDRQIRDEVMTILLTGYETTANALTWTWYLLGQAPDIEARLHDEIDHVLQGRLPTLADIPVLPFVERVVTESMRLYPPAWILGRRALEPYAINDLEIRQDGLAIMSPWVMHHDARFYPEPDRFHPDRWTPEFRDALPPFAYFPFGGGVRRCIGESFARMELMLLVSIIAQRWRLALVAGHPVATLPLVTLRPKYGMQMTAHRRQ